MADAILLKIERADKHISELHGVIDAFKASDPYQLIGKRDPNTGEHVAYLHSAKPIPDAVPVITGDIVQNLYCALDYLATELVIAGGGKPTTKTAFPITKNIPSTRDEISRYEGQVEGMRQEVKDKLLLLKTYRGANNSFWRLHKLNNLNKHRSLITTIIQPSGFGAWGDLADRIKLHFGPLELGSEVARFPADAHNYKDVQFTIDIALHEPEADAIHYPLIIATRLSHTTVRRTVEDFEAFRT